MKTATNKQKGNTWSNEMQQKKEDSTPKNKVTVNDLKGKKVDAFPDNEEDKPLDTLHKK